MEDDQKIRANIRALREKHGLSQGELGVRANFGQTDISKLEKGKAKITMDKLIRIARALGEPFDSLLANTVRPAGEDTSALSVSPLPLVSQQMFAPGMPPLPVRGIAQGGDGGAHMLPDGSSPVDYTPRPASLANVPDAYALFVFEDSMHPMYKHGWTMWVHPHQPAAPGDGIVILKKDGAVMVKELVRRTSKVLRVKQYSPPAEFDIPQGEIGTIHRVVGCLQGR
jgi:phage repressor protein C with HTH and peptisase S24 domain